MTDTEDPLHLEVVVVLVGLVERRLDLDILENLGDLFHDCAVFLERRIHVPDLENVRVPACRDGQAEDLIVY